MSHKLPYFCIASGNSSLSSPASRRYRWIASTTSILYTSLVFDNNGNDYHSHCLTKFEVVGFPTFSVPLLHRASTSSKNHSPCAVCSCLSHCSTAGTLQFCSHTVRENLTMNKSVAEAARRIFGNLPASKGRSGNKVLRKNMIGHKIAEVRHWASRTAQTRRLRSCAAQHYAIYVQLLAWFLVYIYGR